ncbi:MAG: tRNA threonylcarbamoyladenosine dehydratase [Candidatus Gastranaerophilales bacterium]|nr:tRNA threonylcarbamoyladenosine dehydratase [Candidatus Gastranaerophilales bacterium]
MKFDRTKSLIGDNALLKLANSKIAIFGIGGVGGYVAEALIRAGVGEIDLIDNDVVNETNINRQIVALNSTIGKYKVDIMKQRAIDINPDIKVNTFKVFFDENSINEFDFKKYDYVIDAIDSVKSKILLVEICKNSDVPIISSMGTGNKLDPTKFEIADISKTSVCPLARVMRVELKKRGIKNLKVLYSTESPLKTSSRTPSSISFVPSVAGLILASAVVRDLIEAK